MEVTKKEAVKILRISPKEVIRRIERGELKGRKKTTSKFSDWIVELPAANKEREAVQEVKDVLITLEPKIPESIETPESVETEEPVEELELKESDEIHETPESAKPVKPEPVEIPDGKMTETVELERPKIQIQKEVKTNVDTIRENERRAKAKRASPKRDDTSWWYGA